MPRMTWPPMLIKCPRPRRGTDRPSNPLLSIAGSRGRSRCPRSSTTARGPCGAIASAGRRCRRRSAAHTGANRARPQSPAQPEARFQSPTHNDGGFHPPFVRDMSRFTRPPQPAQPEDEQPAACVAPAGRAGAGSGGAARRSAAVRASPSTCARPGSWPSCAGPRRQPIALPTTMIAMIWQPTRHQRPDLNVRPYLRS